MLGDPPLAVSGPDRRTPLRRAAESEARMYTRLIPVLPVGDVLAERGFYEALGFRRHTDPDEQYPEAAFAALEFGPAILFGVSVDDDFDPSRAESRLWWQFESSDLDAVHQRASAAGLAVVQPPTEEAWGRRTLKLRSPNGYLVTFEEGADPLPWAAPSSP